MRKHKVLSFVVAAATALCLNAQTGDDKNFVRKAAEGGLAEVEMGRLAQKNASNDAVKKFGDRMVADHTKVNDDLKSLASKKGIDIPTNLTGEHKSSHDKLAAKTGADFDKAYMSMMLKDHNMDVREFERQANSGSDPDIKAFAANHLPTLRDHLKMAQDIAKQLGISPSTGD